MLRALVFPFILLFASAAFAQDGIVTKSVPITELRPVFAGHKKKALLVNFWATWCGPCKVEFPHLVKADAEFRGKGLDVVIVSMDNLGAADTIVADFLRSYESTMTSFLFDGPRELLEKQLRRYVADAPPGIPLTLLFDDRMRLAYMRSGMINPDVLRANIFAVLPAPAETPKKRLADRRSLK